MRHAWNCVTDFLDAVFPPNSSASRSACRSLYNHMFNFLNIVDFTATCIQKVLDKIWLADKIWFWYYEENSKVRSSDKNSKTLRMYADNYIGLNQGHSDA